MKFILGKKLNMSQIFSDDGKVIPVTIIQAGPCQISQVKTQEKDGYRAVQIGFYEKKKLTKSLTGHLKNLPKFRYLREFKIDDSQELKKDQEVNVSVFQSGDKVKVTGITKGRGFQGVVKRHGFHGAPASHGHKDQERMPGSIGSTDAARVFKGKKMPGQMGNSQVTVTGLEIVKIDKENNILYIKGAVPGARNGLLLISGPGELKIPEIELVEPINQKVSMADDVSKESEVVTEKAEVKTEAEVENNQIASEEVVVSDQELGSEKLPENLAEQK